MIWGHFNFHLIEKVTVALSTDCSRCPLVSHGPSSCPVRCGVSHTSFSVFSFLSFICSLLPTPSSHSWFMRLCPSLPLPCSISVTHSSTRHTFCGAHSYLHASLSVATSLSGLPLGLAQLNVPRWSALACWSCHTPVSESVASRLHGLELGI